MAGRIVRIVRYLPPDSEEEWTQGEYVESDEDVVAVTLGEGLFYEMVDGQIIVEKDYHVGGEIWQVHKSDADPYPSQPHAHCVGGRQKFIGLKLHLGTRQLWDGRRPMNLLLPKKPFARLIEMVRRKFPSVTLPIPDCEPILPHRRYP